MFGLSFSHLILFGIILLIFVGPEQLPEVARTIGRILNELRRATQDFQSQFTGQFKDESQALHDLRNQIAANPPKHSYEVEHKNADAYPAEPTGHGPEAFQGKPPAAAPAQETLPEGAHPVSEDEEKKS